jgi:hypothetical protein
MCELVLINDNTIVDVFNINLQDLYGFLLTSIEDLYSRGFHEVRIQWEQDPVENGMVIELNVNYKIQLDGNFSRIRDPATISVKYY